VSKHEFDNMVNSLQQVNLELNKHICKLEEENNWLRDKLEILDSNISKIEESTTDSTEKHSKMLEDFVNTIEILLTN